MRCRIGTVNDVHFGEVEAGRIDDHTDGPIRRAAPGEPPYPETMNHARGGRDGGRRRRRGDRQGRPVDRRHARGVRRLRGTATGSRSATASSPCAATTTPTAASTSTPATSGSSCRASTSPCSTPSCPSAAPATCGPSRSTGSTPRAAASTVPVLVMGHHQQLVSGATRSPDYFGIDPDASDALVRRHAAAPGDRRLHRRPHPPPPRPLDRRHDPVDRGRLRQGLPRHVGRVPRVRRRDPAGRPPHVDAGRAGVERAVPHAVLRLRRRLRGVRDGNARGALLRDPVAAIRALAARRLVGS